MSLDPLAFERLAKGIPAEYRIAADWLLERGDARGEFILDELMLAERPNPSTRKAALLRRAEREKTLQPRIEAPLRALGVTECEYHWGFVSFVRLPEKALGALPKLLELEPITRLGVSLGDGAGLAETMRWPGFGRIRELQLSGRAERALAVAPAAPGIESLTLRADPATVQRACELFPGLKRLNLASGHLGRGGTAAVEALASGRLALEQLWVPDTGVSSASVISLAKTSSPIQSLCLAFNGLNAAALRALGESRGLAALRELDVRGRERHQGFLTTGLPALKKLRVSWPQPLDRQLYASRGISLH